MILHDIGTMQPNEYEALPWDERPDVPTIEIHHDTADRWGDENDAALCDLLYDAPTVERRCLVVTPRIVDAVMELAKTARYCILSQEGTRAELGAFLLAAIGHHVYPRFC